MTTPVPAEAVRLAMLARADLLLDRPGAMILSDETLTRRMLEAAQPVMVADALGASLSALTDRLIANKVRQGFSTTNFPLEIALLHAEVSEIFEAWRRGKPVGPEAADALLFLLSLARMAGVDLGAEAVAKMAVNEAREYVRQPNGLHVQKGAPGG